MELRDGRDSAGFSKKEDNCNTTELTELNAGANSSCNDQKRECDTGLTQPGEYAEEEGRVKHFCSLFRETCFRRNFIQTFCVYYNFILLGWTYGQLGTAFQDLQLILKTNVQQTSLIFTMNSVGYMVGGLLIGYLYDRVNKLLLLGVVSILNGISSAIIPWCNTFGLFLAVRLLGGLLCGGQDTGGNAKVASSWNTEGRQFMQALHFAYAFGGIISPLVTRLFLAPRIVNPANMTSNIPQNTTFVSINSANMTVGNDLMSYGNLNYTTALAPAIVNTSDGVTETWTLITNNDTNELKATETLDILYGESNVHVAFVITGILMVISGLLYILLYVKGFDKTPPYSRRVSRKNKDTVVELIKEENRIKMTNTETFIFLVVMAFAVILYGAIECKLQSFLMPFVLMQLNWTKDAGAFLIAVSWGFYGFGRLCGVPVSRFISPATMVIAYLSLNILASLVMLMGGIWSLDSLIWISVSISGWAISVIFPAFFVWTDENAMVITGKMASFFLFTGALGFMIDPLYIGVLMENLSPMYFVYIQIAETGLCLSVFVILLIGARYLRRK